MTAVAILPEGTRQKGIPKGNLSLPPQSVTRLPVPMAVPHFLPDARTVTWETEDGLGFSLSGLTGREKKKSRLSVAFSQGFLPPHIPIPRRAHPHHRCGPALDKAIPPEASPDPSASAESSPRWDMETVLLPKRASL